MLLDPPKEAYQQEGRIPVLPRSLRPHAEAVDIDVHETIGPTTG